MTFNGVSKLPWGGLITCRCGDEAIAALAAVNVFEPINFFPRAEILLQFTPELASFYKK